MSVLERRLQLLLDEARYARIAAEATSSGRSVAAVIREAIDLRFPAGDDLRVEAANELLTRSVTPEPGLGVGPAELKLSYEHELADRLGAP